MDYLPYLEPAALEVHHLLTPLVRVVENGPACRRFDIFGYFDARKRQVTICTTRIRDFPDVHINVSATLLHEAVHVAQACRTRFRGLRPFGMSRSAMVISAEREKAWNVAIRHGPGLEQLEREAFFLEDKPKRVRYVLQKYCR